MHIIRSLMAAAGAVCLSFTPAIARTSQDLIDTIRDVGVNVHINGDHCTGGYFGKFSFNAERNFGRVVLCPGPTVDPIDHATVIHEAMHVAQYCYNKRLGRPHNTPILDYDELVEKVNKYVHEDEVVFVKSSYERDVWLVEFEASLAENIFSQADMIEIVNTVCR